MKKQNACTYSSYWRLVFDPDDPRARTIKHVEVDWTDSDIVNLSVGRPVNGNLGAKVKLSLNDGEGPVEDLVPNPQGWLVCSERLVDTMMSMIKNSVQTFNIPIWDPVTSCILQSYYIIHVIDIRDCIDASRSSPRIDRRSGRREGFIEYYVDPVRAQESNIFRYSDPPDYVDTGYTCSSKLLVHIAGRGFSGIGFIQCEGKTLDE